MGTDAKCAWYNEPLIRAFVALEAALLILVEAFQALSCGQTTNSTMYLSIVLCTVVTLVLYVRYGTSAQDRRENLIVLAMIATALADLFLTFLNAAWAYVPGITLFCLVQIVYYRYLGNNMLALCARVGLSVALIVVAFCLRIAQPSTILGAIDLVLVLCNSVQAWTSSDKRISVLFKLGITLFLCCDVCVGAQFMVPAAIRFYISLLIWVFYLPSQVLIVLSYADGIAR